MSLLEDARLIAERDPAAKSIWQVIFLYPGFKILVNHKIANFFYRHNRHFLARWISQRGRKKTGIEIHPGAKIGKGLFIDHGMGVVIGETAEIGDNCTIYHGVTLGGTGKDKGKRHPTIGDDVLIGAGATILGPFKVGNRVQIGADTVVLNEIPDGSTVVGARGRIVKNNKGEKLDLTDTPAFCLDQIHLPDPLAQEIVKLNDRIKELEDEMKKLKSEDKNEDI